MEMVRGYGGGRRCGEGELHHHGIVRTVRHDESGLRIVGTLSEVQGETLGHPRTTFSSGRRDTLRGRPSRRLHRRRTTVVIHIVIVIVVRKDPIIVRCSVHRCER